MGLFVAILIQLMVIAFSAKLEEEVAKKDRNGVGVALVLVVLFSAGALGAARYL